MVAFARIVIAGLLTGCGMPPSWTWARQPESWGPSRGRFAHFGLVSEVCNNDRDTVMCLALACRGRGLALVSVAGGGGPMEGATTIRFGHSVVRSTFVWRNRAVDVMGVAAARARVPTSLVAAMAASGGIDLRMENAGPDDAHHYFATRGLGRELQRAIAVCGRRSAPG